MDDKTFLVMRNYDRLSRWYDLLSGSGEFSIVKQAIDLLNLRPGNKALEIGSGTGRAGALISDRIGASGELVFVDVSAGMLKVSRNRVRKTVPQKIGFIQGDAANLPLKNDTFNAVLSTFTLEILQEDARSNALHSINSVLVEGGYLCCVTISSEPSNKLVMMIYNYLRLHIPHIIDCQPINLAEQLSAAGFKIVYSKIVYLWSIPVEILLSNKALGGVE